MNRHRIIAWIYSIRTKLVFSFFIMLAIFSLASLFSYYGEQSLLDRINGLLARNIALKDYNHHVDSLLQNLEKYLAATNYDMLSGYHRENQYFLDHRDLVLRGIDANDEYALMMRNLESLTNSFLAGAEKAVQAKRGRNSYEYNKAFMETVRYGENIKWGIDQVIAEQLAEDSKAHLIVLDRLKVLQKTGMLLVMGALGFSLLITTWMSFRVTKPLRMLAGYAESITKGELSVQPLEVLPRKKDEIAVVTRAFNEMVASLIRLIGEIKSQSDLEKKLQEQELQNLAMKNFLREAELHALQSQINPHFLYNTLNAGVQLAALEGSEKTAEFIDTLAHLLRYNLKKLDASVSLREEIDNLNRYFQILLTRFGNTRFEIIQEIDEGATSVLIPNLTLQPLVENSLIHGLEDQERAGKIELFVRNTKENVLVTIRDNGKGISHEKLEELNAKQQVTGHTTGIGLRNVKERLRLFFNREDLIQIESEENVGTTIRLTLPKTDFNAEEEETVATADCR